MSTDLDRPSWFRYALAGDALAAYAAALALPDRETALDTLAAAISSGLDRDAELTVAAAMVHGEPTLMALARGGDRAASRLRAQLAGVDSACRRLRWVGHREAAEVATRLARRLRSSLRGRLRDFQLTAIPRGGWLAAGLVAQQLPDCIGAGQPPSKGPVLVVDDCAFSGAAFRGFAATLAGRAIVFAPLFATAGLCHALEREDPGVEAVVCGELLPDRGAELLGEGYEAWRRRVAAVLTGRPAWVGLTDFVCFPWNEPQRWVLDPLTESLDRGWSIIPPAPRGRAAATATFARAGRR